MPSLSVRCKCLLGACNDYLCARALRNVIILSCDDVCLQGAFLNHFGPFYCDIQYTESTQDKSAQPGGPGWLLCVHCPPSHHHPALDAFFPELSDLN